MFKIKGLLSVLMTVCCMSLSFETINAQSDQNQNTIMTAVPFLKIVPDARSSAMGDVGIAIDPDPNTMYYNASNLVFSEYDFGLSLTCLLYTSPSPRD